MKTRIEMLKELIHWRDLSDEDLAHVDMDSPLCLNEEYIFPRNSINALFKYYYHAENTVEIERFSELIIGKMKESSHYCLYYGNAFKKILNYLEKGGKYSEAKQLCEKYLISVAVLNKFNDGIEFYGFENGNYADSFPVIFTVVYIKLMIVLKEKEAADKLIEKCLLYPDLKEDAKIVFRKIHCDKKYKKAKPKYQILRVSKRYIDTSERVEVSALNHLTSAFNMDGIFADFGIWLLLPSVIEDNITDKEFAEKYNEITSQFLPDSFPDFLKTNTHLFNKILNEESITFGQIGYPDLIIYNPLDYSDFQFIEVKGINDKLMPRQEAWLEFFVTHKIPYKIFQYVEKK